jgi:glycosyltransferase involved in cell wall biosynthesis
MEIALLSINYLPQNFGIAKIAVTLAHYLEGRGDNIKVITANPFDQNFRKTDKKFADDNKDRNIKVIRVPVYLFKNNNFINRVLFDSSFFINSIFKTLKHCRRADKIIIISPPLQLGLIGIILNIFYKKEFIFYVQDLIPDLPEKLGIIKSPGLLKLLTWLEKTIYKKAYKIITISEGMAENIKKKLLPEDYPKVFTVNNWTDKIPEEIIVENAGKPFLKSLNLDDKIVALYSGSFGKKQAFESSINILKLISTRFPEVHFLFVGDGPDKEKFIKEVNLKNLNNITFLGSLNEEDYRQVNKESHFVFFTQDKNITNELMPSKIISSIAMGKPVFCLANRNSDVALLINNAKCGIVCDVQEINNSGNEKFYSAFSPLMDEKIRYEFAENARKYADINFQKDLLLEKLAGIITF